MKYLLNLIQHLTNMHLYHRYTFSLFLTIFLHQCLAQDEKGHVTEKISKGAVEEILQKIHKISEQKFSNASYNGKLEMLRMVEEKLSKGARTLGKKGERYVKLIMKGIKARAFEEVNRKARPETQVSVPVELVSNDNISKIEDNSTIVNDNLLMELVMNSENHTERDLNQSTQIDIRNSETISYTQDTTKRINFVSKNPLRRTNVNIDESHVVHNNSNNLSVQTSTERLVNFFTPSYECEGTLDRTCVHIKEMRRLKCNFNDKEICIEKLCDGFVDCIDRTDEKFCTSQVTERIHNAIQVVSEAEQSFALGCFPNNTKKSIITTQVITFRNILEAQQQFVEKYKYLNMSLLPNVNPRGEGTVKKTVNEVSLVISALALALDASLCSQRIKMDDVLNARKFNDLALEDLDETVKDIRWPPRSCNCVGGRCQNNTCTDSCKRTCYQKYSLTRWGCESINKTENVPMSVICDGKFDCFDQSDEKDCVTVTSFAKFEAHELFKDILNSLSVKITSKDLSSIRNMYLALHNSIEKLQKICMSSKPDVKMISKLRTKCFAALSSIYSETLVKSSFPYETEEIYNFLLTLNENIVNALKRSHTGNTRVISNIACFCKNERCSMPICSRNCIRSCIAEPKITRYYCESSSNISVSLNDICNGEPNCPKGDDETNCKKDVCRRHHLGMLRRSLERVGKKREGTSMGELLATWKTKVTSTLLIVENNDRPNPKIIRETVKDILRDLVNTYGAVEDYRRDNEYALDEFINIARNVISFIRSCGY